MAAQHLTLALPELIYQQLQERARQAQRSVEDEAADVLTEAVVSPARLPEDLETELAALQLLHDHELWQAARMRLSDEATTQLARLNRKRQREGLTAAEEQQASLLLRQYDRVMLVRAQAAALLKHRGHDISSLFQAP
ncbi:MAG: hypothetical protein MUD01_08930 [Chloroflexaceae bacterium]|jgi:plasmid stability protein|nr:hypothetical protein [Chloroflexaceae bacterium]